MNKAVVNSIEPNSPAERLGINSGDEILSIDGVEPKDLIDYRFLISSEKINLQIKKNSGEKEIFLVKKKSDEDLGINFESAVFDRVIPCANNCIFCFIDQQPKGLRKSLYVKDDDYRLSYLQGTYITLTNLRKKDRQRIETLRPGPLYISVHTTNPDLRQKMLQNPAAKNIMQELKWLNSLEIPLHAQIVLCPGINDKEELRKTLKDLFKFKKTILSIAVVPVGITKFRKENGLEAFASQEALEIIETLDKFNKKAGFSFFIPSDEFYILANEEFPEKKYYRGFGQLDDGVGTARILLEDYKKHRKNLPKELKEDLSITIASGELACKIMEPIIEDLNKIINLNVNTISVKSNFWGENITVSGLITGQDLIESVKPFKENIKNLFIPSVMLRKFTNQFLDNYTLEKVSRDLGLPVKVIENYYSMKELIDFIRV